MNSLLNYSVVLMQRAGLAGTAANWADALIKFANLFFTCIAMALAGADVSSVEQGLRRFVRVPDLDRLWPSLFHHGNGLLAGNERQVAGRDRTDVLQVQWELKIPSVESRSRRGAVLATSFGRAF